MRIGQLAVAAGVEPATLRTWETRYGVPSPVRTEGGQRRYPAKEVERVRRMRDLVSAGYRASEAAAVVAAGWPGPESTGPKVGVEDILALLVEGQAAPAFRLLDQLTTTKAVEEVITGVLVPVMQTVGQRWADGSLTVAEEHAASSIVSGWLGGLTRGLPPPLQKGLVALCAPPGERHEIGLVMLSVFLRRQGIAVLHLGSDLPAEDIASLARRRNATFLAIGVTVEEAWAGAEATIRAAVSARVPTGVGGPAARDRAVGAGVAVLPTELPAATRRIVELASA